MITLKDFKEETNPWRYYSMKKQGFTLNLEPCMSGFDIALYKKGNLVQPKLCTSLQQPISPSNDEKLAWNVDKFKTALSYASDIWKARNEK